MQTLSLKENIPGGIKVHGALDFDRRHEGLGVRRLPAWTRPQVPEGLDVMARMPSGVRICMQSNATRIGLDAITGALAQANGETRPVHFDLQMGDSIQNKQVEPTNKIVVRNSTPGQFEVVRSDLKTVWFEDLGSHSKFVEIWLPHNAFVTLQAIHLDGEIETDLQDKRPQWIHYGSSISHCMEASSPSQTWPAVAARATGLSLTSFGFGGQCHLDPFVARTIAKLQADLISIKVGINIINMDSMKERVFVPLLHGFLDTIREQQPMTPICLISPIFCPSAEEHPGPTIPNSDGKFETLPGLEQFRQGSMSLQRVREILADVVRLRSAADANLDYLDGLKLFSASDEHLLPDHLHPNNEGYARMGNRFSELYLRPHFAKGV